MESKLKAIIHDSLKYMPNLRKINGQGKWHAPPRLKLRLPKSISNIPILGARSGRGPPLRSTILGNYHPKICFSNGVIILFLLLFCLILPALFPSLLAANLSVDITADGTPVHQATAVIEGDGRRYEAVSQWGVADFGDSVYVSIGFDPNVVLAYSLFQNFPNPFNPSTNINYSVPEATHVSLVIYDLGGKHVRTLVDGVKSPGDYTVRWDGRNDAGKGAAASLYLYRMIAGNYTSFGKMIMIDGASGVSGRSGGGNGGTKLSDRWLGKSADGIRDAVYSLEIFNTDSTSPQIEDYVHPDDLNMSGDTTVHVSVNPLDLISPSDIADLMVSTGGIGQINLNWTAPGDDGNIGTASSYIVKINTVPIDSSNWDASVDVNGEPTPESAGTPQSMSVSTSLGEMIYAAMKAIDDNGNESGVSNTDSAMVGSYLILGQLTEVPRMFGVDSATVSLGQYTAISDSGAYTLTAFQAITDTFSVTAMGFYTFAEPDVTATDGMQKNVEMIQQYTDDETGEDLWTFLRWSTTWDAEGSTTKRWRDENLPINVFINRTYLDTAAEYDYYDTNYGEGAYADSVWVGIQSWENKVNEVATAMGIDSLDLVQEVAYDPVEELDGVGFRVRYDYHAAGYAYLLEIFEDEPQAPKKSEIRIRGVPYQPLHIDGARLIVSHETGHILMFMEHSPYGTHIMGFANDVSDFEARMCLLLYTIENGTRMDFYTVPDAGRTNSNTNMTSMPQFE